MDGSEGVGGRRRPLDQPTKLEKCFAAANGLEAQLVSTASEHGSRQLSLAITKAQEARMWIQEEMRFRGLQQEGRPGAQVVTPEATHRGPISAPQRGVHQGG